ncbi:MAG: S-layer homology domain-containing protein [Tissierellia bacterium]|nr:S-layer homology domain-containing protein [Tissierellia bacterium]
MAVILDKFMKVEKKEKPVVVTNVNFTDGDKIDSWAKEAIENMASRGLLKGMEDGKFYPDGIFTRAQVAQVLYNLDSQ